MSLRDRSRYKTISYLRICCTDLTKRTTLRSFFFRIFLTTIRMALSKTPSSVRWVLLQSRPQSPLSFSSMLRKGTLTKWDVKVRESWSSSTSFLLESDWLTTKKNTLRMFKISELDRVRFLGTKQKKKKKKSGGGGWGRWREEIGHTFDVRYMQNSTASSIF